MRVKGVVHECAKRTSDSREGGSGGGGSGGGEAPPTMINYYQFQITFGTFSTISAGVSSLSLSYSGILIFTM